MSTTCHECGAPEGSLHNRACPIERCPFCFDQLITCNCIYLHFNYKPQPMDSHHPTMGLPKNIFINGLPKERLDKWDEVVTRRGRIPFFHFPSICTRCGCMDPDPFMVPDAEWCEVVPLDHREDILCRGCFDEMQRLHDANA